MGRGICPLFDKETEICKSHIFPKFVYKDLKWSNQAKFVNREHKCPPMQAGYKIPLLGQEAEIHFSKYENWFAQHIYRPLRNGELINNINYDKNLYYFSILQTWRGCIYATKKYGKDDFADELFYVLRSAMDEWKNYLVNGVIPAKYDSFYLMPMREENIRFPRYLEVDFYIKRALEFNLMVTDEGNAIYTKLPSMVIWAPLDRQRKTDYGFKIMPEGGSFDFSNYVITDANILDYLSYKISQTVEWRKRIALTNPQKIKDNQDRMAKDQEFQESELAEILSLPSLSAMQMSGAEYMISHIY